MNAGVSAIADRFGGIDIVVGCAGISGPAGRPIDHVTIDEWNAVLAINVTGQFLLVRAALPRLIGGRDPAVILMASDSSFVAAPGMAAHNASKGAMLQLARALSVDLAADGVRVNCVCPSIADTAMSRTDLGVEVAGFSEKSYPVRTPTFNSYACSLRIRKVRLEQNRRPTARGVGRLTPDHSPAKAGLVFAWTVAGWPDRQTLA